jgi:SAM-dependent methyltransferase
MAIERYLPIDEEGYFVFEGKRVSDEALGRKLLEAIAPFDSHRFQTNLNGEVAWIEAFDAPLVAKHVQVLDAETGELDLPYNTKMRFPLASLCLDEWDRFHGVTAQGVPFVFSRQCQVEFFDRLDAFDDETITIKGKVFEIPPWLAPNSEISKPNFWNQQYESNTAGWDLGTESGLLPQVLPQLKLTKARVLVLGAGNGHDAAYFAKLGHQVTAVDFSTQAIQKARSLYSQFENLSFVEKDVFNLPEGWTGQFDIVFEHTCYCAINPQKRNELVKTWKRMLHAQGTLLGVFFVMEKPVGPPFGGSEWELRQRLQKDYQFLFWTRWKHSIEKRKSSELLLYARKR